VVPRPTCHGGAGKPCVLSAGGPRIEPHTDRKLLAVEAMEEKRTKKPAQVVKRESNAALLERLKRECAKPRAGKSARENKDKTNR
jgi:hypothetical protein